MEIIFIFNVLFKLNSQILILSYLVISDRGKHIRVYCTRETKNTIT